MLIVYKDDQNIQELNMNKVLNCLASIHQLSVFYKNHQISPIQFNHLNSFTSNSDHKIIYPKSK